MQIQNGINLLWPTPLYKTTIDQEFCGELLNELFTQNVFEQCANGEDNILDIDTPIIGKFHGIVENCFSDYFEAVLGMNLEDYERGYKSWITGKPGMYNMQHHNHSGSPFVSVFYIFAREEDVGGEIVLNDPRVNANRGYLPEFQDSFKSLSHKPVTGDVLIFPGYLYHSVNPFMSDMRVAVPVDLLLYGKKDGRVES